MNLFTIILMVNIGLPLILAHSHSDHEKVHGHKERVEDGHYKDGVHQDQYDHEAILGGKEKAKEFGELPPEEAKKRLRVLVTKGGMDVNADGFVDKEELTEWVKDSFHSLSREDAAERLKEDDENKDGLVTWEEYVKDNFDTETSPEDVELMKEDKILWDAADGNGDGALNEEEYAAFNSPEEYEQMHTALYKIAMAKRDKNKDGYLDLQEFLEDDDGEQMDEKDENYILEKDKFNNDYDKDKDGKLNEEEVKLWLIPDNKEMAASEAEHLIKNSDDDNDGKLSVDEIVKNHDVFVGSEATDFGEKLKMHEEL